MIPDFRANGLKSPCERSTLFPVVWPNVDGGEINLWYQVIWDEVLASLHTMDCFNCKLEV